MLIKTRQFRLSVGGSHPRVPAQTLLGRILTGALGVVVLVAAFMVSVVVLAVAATVLLLVVGYLWWKTRALRRRLREQMGKGQVIDGEAVRDGTSR